MSETSSTRRSDVLAVDRLRGIDVHVALDRSQNARRTLVLADQALRAATSAFDAGLDEQVGSRQLSMLDVDVETARASQALAAWSNAESEAALIGAAGLAAGTATDRHATHHRATFPADPHAVSQIRRLLRDHLGHVVDEDLLGDIEVMASEVATNCVRYENPVVLAVEIDVLATTSHQTTITVTLSGGHAALPESLIHPTAGIDLVAQSGRGLGILDSLAQVWGTQRRHRRTSVWFCVTTTTARRRIDDDVADHAQRAAAVLADAAAIAAEAESQVLAEFEDAARITADHTQTAVAAAALTAARAVDTARRSRALAVVAAAAAVAHAADRSAQAVATASFDLGVGTAPDPVAARAVAAAAAVIADAARSAASTTRDAAAAAARTDARLAADAAEMVRDVAERTAEAAAEAADVARTRIRDAATARRAVYTPPALTGLTGAQDRRRR